MAVADGTAYVAGFDVDALLGSSAYEISAGDALRAVPVPAGTQGAVWGELGGIGPGLWLATSTASCGVLVGPDGHSRGFVPGAESMSLVGPDELWVVSESGSRLYQRLRLAAPGRNSRKRSDPAGGACRVDVRRALGQRVSRCAVCLRQRGQNFASSSRSGSLRRFFLVM